jgi:Cu/Ag efflux protein CusF
MRHIRRWISTAMTASLCAFAGSAAAQQPTQPAPPPQATPTAGAAEVVTATATVEKVDAKHRKVKLMRDDGSHVTVRVPENVQGLDRLKKGDHINMAYVESVAVAIQPPGSAPPKATTTEQTGNLPNQPGAYRVETQTVQARIVAVNTVKNQVTFEGPKGDRETVTVKDPDVQAQLPNLKPGQNMQITYREAVAASITPPPSGT